MLSKFLNQQNTDVFHHDLKMKTNITCEEHRRQGYKVNRETIFSVFQLDNKVVSLSRFGFPKQKAEMDLRSFFCSFEAENWQLHSKLGCPHSAPIRSVALHILDQNMELFGSMQLFGSMFSLHANSTHFFL